MSKSHTSQPIYQDRTIGENFGGAGACPRMRLDLWADQDAARCAVDGPRAEVALSARRPAALDDEESDELILVVCGVADHVDDRAPW